MPTPRAVLGARPSRLGRPLRPPRILGLGLLAVAVAVVAAGCSSPVRPPVGAQLPDGAHVLFGGTSVGHSTAEMDLVSGVTAVVVASANLHGSLYRVTSPTNASIDPQVDMQGTTVNVSTSSGTISNDAHGPAALTISLAQGVRWTLDLGGGATTTTIAFGSGSLAAINFVAGVSQINGTLPPPDGTMQVTISGGASEVRFALAKAPARVSFVGGASSYEDGSVSHTGIAGGTVFTEASWSASSNRYSFDNVAGVSSFAVTRTPGA